MAALIDVDRWGEAFDVNGLSYPSSNSILIGGEDADILLAKMVAVLTLSSSPASLLPPFPLSSSHSSLMKNKVLFKNLLCLIFPVVYHVKYIENASPTTVELPLKLIS